MTNPRDLDAAWAAFNGTSKDRELLNTALAKRRLEPMNPMTEEAWRKR